MPDIAPDAANKEKLEEIIQKDEKKGRAMSGLWYWLAAGMGIFMVLFYMYCAAEPIDTQYFLRILCSFNLCDGLFDLPAFQRGHG
jgi:heme/copper-type cytochrome/quinol oxidase subunit 3